MLAVLVSSLAWGVPAAAQPVTGRVTLAVDRSSVSVGEVVRLEVRAEVVGDLNPRIQPPDATGFDVVGTQTSSQFSFGGGRPQATTTQYLSLLARSPGRFEIGPAHAIAAGRAFSSNVVTVEVAGAGGVVPPGPDPGQAEPSPIGGEAMTFDPECFVRTTADIAEPYVGQQVTVTVYLYLRATLQSPPAIRQEPTTDGFWTHSLVPTSRTLEVTQQVVRGAYFNVVVLRRFAAFPLRAGELTIGPTSISITPLGGIFAILGGGGGGPPLDRTGEPLAIRVRELPAAGRPPGPVHTGRLELEAQLDRTQVATGDAVTLRLRASGRGHVAQLRVGDPRVPGLRVLAPEVDGDVQSPGDVVQGTRTWEWLVVPEREGRYSIPAFEIAVFDPHAQTYSVARSQALSLVAAGNAIAEPEPDVPSAVTPGPIASAPSFGPVRTRAALAREHHTWAEAAWLPWAFGVPPLAFAGALVVRRARRRTDDPKKRPERAARAARKRLAEAERLASAGDGRGFYAAIAQSIKEVLEAKLGRPIGSLTYPELRAMLGERGLEGELRDRVADELEGCDFARFSAAGVAVEEMQRCLSRTQEILSALDRFQPKPEDE